MIRVGDIVDATVVEVAPFGLFVEANGISGLIQLPQLSWQRVSDPSTIAGVGDRIRCKVMLTPPKYRSTDPPRFIGSIRDLHPELNPWRDPTVFAVGNQFSGVVEQHMSYGVFIRHPREAAALLHIDAYDSESITLAVGETVDVVITHCDVDSKKILVRLK